MISDTWELTGYGRKRTQSDAVCLLDRLVNNMW